MIIILSVEVHSLKSSQEIIEKNYYLKYKSIYLQLRSPNHTQNVVVLMLREIDQPIIKNLMSP